MVVLSAEHKEMCVLDAGLDVVCGCVFYLSYFYTGGRHG